MRACRCWRAHVPGDYVYVPPYVPHHEENPSPDEPIVVVLARSTQEGIVVNLPSLRAPVPELDRLIAELDGELDGRGAQSGLDRRDEISG